MSDQVAQLREKVEALQALITIIAPFVLKANGITPEFIRAQGEELAERLGPSTWNVVPGTDYHPARTLFADIALLMTDTAEREHKG